MDDDPIRGDLHVCLIFDDLRLQIVHEGMAGNLPVTQATILQMVEAWPEVLAQTFGASKAATGDPA